MCICVRKADGLQHMAQVGVPDLGRFVWPGEVVLGIMALWESNA